MTYYFDIANESNRARVEELFREQFDKMLRESNTEADRKALTEISLDAARGLWDCVAETSSSLSKEAQAQIPATFNRFIEARTLYTSAATSADVYATTINDILHDMTTN